MDYFLFAMTTFVITLLITAMLAFLPSGTTITRISNAVGAFGAMIGCAAGICIVISDVWSQSIQYVLPWGLPIGTGNIELDALSALFLIPVFGLGFVCAWSGFIALRNTVAGTHNLGAHWLFYILLLIGMMLVMTARDAVLFLFAWEIMSVSPFFLIDFNDNERSVRESAWVYLVAAHLGAVFLFGLFTILWTQSGTTTFTDFAALPHTALTSLLFVLALIGFGAKAGLAPLHIWLPEAHPAAPSHISAILSGAMINAGLYGIIRSMDFLGPMSEFSAWWGWIVLGIGLGTSLMAILKAMAQSNIKKMLAYSSVENMGIMLIGIGAGIIGLVHDNMWIAALGFGASLFHMLNHAAFKGLLFLCAGEILHSTGTVNMSSLGGLQHKMPVVGILFALGSAAIACLPPLNGFCGELALVLGLARGTTLTGVENQIGLLMTLAVVALISGCAAVAFAKSYGMTFLGQSRSAFAEHVHSPTVFQLLPLFIPAACCVIFGIAAPDIFNLASHGVVSILQNNHADSPSAIRALADMNETLKIVARIGIISIAITIVLLIVRRIMIGSKKVRSSSTWGCGYRFATSRVQYTDTSFAEPMTKIFGQAMGVCTDKKTDLSSPFPQSGRMRITAPDRLLSHFYTPLFEHFCSLCDSAKIVQHGRIHLYILYILATVIALLIWAFTGGDL